MDCWFPIECRIRPAGCCSSVVPPRPWGRSPKLRPCPVSCLVLGSSLTARVCRPTVPPTLKGQDVRYFAPYKNPSTTTDKEDRLTLAAGTPDRSVCQPSGPGGFAVEARRGFRTRKGKLAPLHPEPSRLRVIRSQVFMGLSSSARAAQGGV